MSEKQIVKLLKQNVSQSAIAKQLGVPRSAVQRVSDKLLGVDPESIKSLTTEQITEIQALSKAGAANADLARKYGVSPKTIARALLVRVVAAENNVTVITPITEVDENGDVLATLEVLEGATALDTNRSEWYVAKYMEKHGGYLALTKQVDGIFVGAFFKAEDLTPLEKSSLYNGETGLAPIQCMAELAKVLTDSAYKAATNSEFTVVVDGEKYPLRGTLDARRRVGFFDAILNRTQRLSLSSVQFVVKLGAERQLGEGEELQTKEDLQAKDLDVFLNEHQILILPESVVITMNGKPETVTTSHQSYKAIVQAIHDRDIKRAYDLMKPREIMKDFTEGMVTIEGRRVLWGEHDVSNTSIARRILALVTKGDKENLVRLMKFMSKMFENPSAALVQSGKIYEFMSYSDIEIDEDGDIILYKSVRGNYMDKHSGTINNAPGNIVRMARSFVNDNNKDLCSYGLHVCSLAYLKKCFGSMGQRVVRCKLNPKDIVSITDDYGSSKIRCCEYLVLDDYTTEYNRQHKSIDVTGLYK